MFIVGLMSVSTGAATRPSQADLVLLHGRVITVSARDEVAQALAVSGGRILAVGSDRAIERLVGPATRVIDLHGRAVTPGLIDAHAHVADTGETELFQINLKDAASMQDILDRVGIRVASEQPGEWVVGFGWDEGKLAEHRYPTAADLDRVAPNNPVWLSNTTGHFGAANSAALKLAQITAATAAPTGGVIEHSSDGRPTGVLKEAAAQAMQDLIPSYSVAQRRDAIIHMTQFAHSEGMTGFKDADISQSDWQAYRGLAADGQLSAYVCVLFHTPPTLEGANETLAAIRIAQADVGKLGESTLGVCGAKIYMDGSAIGRTAWSYQDWNRTPSEVDTGNSGFPATDPAVYRQQVRLFVDAGVGVGTHAIGDRAIDWVVDSYAEALTANPKLGLRLSVIHANTPSEHAIAVMADLEKRFDSAIPETQSEFIWWLGDSFPASLGMARSQRLVPLHSYLDQGMIWAGGSDAPVTPFAARYGIWSSVARETVKGSYGKAPFGVTQSVDVHAALRSYTIWAARQLLQEKQTGSLERGKSADFAVWDRDPYAVDTSQLKDMTCQMTVFKGKVVYQRPTAAGAMAR